MRIESAVLARSMLKVMNQRDELLEALRELMNIHDCEQIHRRYYMNTAPSVAWLKARAALQHCEGVEL